MMVAAVASALALGGVAVGMAAARTSPPADGGSGTTPLVSRPPAAVSADSGGAAPGARPPVTTAAPAPSGSSRGERRSGSHAEHPGRACGRPVGTLCPPAASQRGGGAGKGGRDGRGGAGESADSAGSADFGHSADSGRSADSARDADGVVVVTGEILAGADAGSRDGAPAAQGVHGFGPEPSASPTARAGRGRWDGSHHPGWRVRAQG
jgi:hypothetical protein